MKEEIMQCKDAMKVKVITCRERDSVSRCAAIMANNGIGFLPVVDENLRVLGVVTDRDLVVRALARRQPESTPIEKVMSRDVVGCAPDDSLARAERLLAESRKSRIVIADEWGRLVGILSLADVAQVEDSTRAGDLLKKITRREATGIVSRP
jgi:CBS domain-containing protein